MERTARLEQRIRFAEFEVDPRAGELRKLGIKIKLQEQPLQVLAMLLEHPGEVVTREELQQRIWPADTFVDFENSLNKAINKLRGALGDSAETPRFVETLPRHGYRFIGSVDGVVEQQSGPLAEDRRASLPLQSRRRLAAVGVGAAILGSLLFGLNVAGLRERVLDRTAVRPIQSLAVLPLENLSGNPSQEYFADGMTEVLISELGKVGMLRVISRTSAMHYKGSKKLLPEIARELNVDAVVEGAVLRSGNRVRITVQLIRAVPEKPLWTESYERDLRDTLVLQSDVAAAIAREVHIMLSPQGQIRLASSRRHVNPEAYDAYLKGRYEASKWTAEGEKKSIEYFEQSIQKDPTYAEAWAELALVYLAGRPDPKGRQAALRALELNETVPQAHTALALVKHWEWAWGAARKELQRAITLDPNNAQAHQFYGYHFNITGRYDEAVAEMKRAFELDPFEGNKRNSLGAALFLAGRDDEALEQYRQTPDPDVNSERRHRIMAEIFRRKGMQKEAITEVLTALRLSGKKDLAELVEQKYLTSGYAEARQTWLREDIKELQRKAKDGRIPSFKIAGDYALLGEKDKAFEWLEKAYRERDPGLIHILDSDRLLDLRSAPRFQDLLRRMGLRP